MTPAGRYKSAHHPVRKGRVVTTCAPKPGSPDNLCTHMMRDCYRLGAVGRRGQQKC